MDIKWYEYEMRVATKNNGIITRCYEGMSDRDACRRGDIKRLHIEDFFSEVVAYQVLSLSTGKIIDKHVYDTILDMI